MCLFLPNSLFGVIISGEGSDCWSRERLEINARYESYRPEIACADRMTFQLGRDDLFGEFGQEGEVDIVSLRVVPVDEYPYPPVLYVLCRIVPEIVTFENMDL